MNIPVVQERGGLILLNNVVIIPTGNEVLSGIVIDTNSPAIMQVILEKYPTCEVTRLKPIRDSEKEIIEVIDRCVSNKYDLVIIIGGSGGGHRFEPSLSEDYTHTAMLKFFNSYNAVEIYGKNGHLWSKIVCSTKESTKIINVPGPYVEAVSAAKALVECYKDGVEDNSAICEKVSEAVISNYSSNAGIKCVRI